MAWVCRYLMPLVLLAIAIVMITIGMRGHAADASQLLASEFTGPNSFVQALLAIGILGAIGYWKPARPFSNGFIGLVVLSLFLNKGTGFFAQLESAFQTTPATPRKDVTGGSAAAITAPVAQSLAPAVSFGNIASYGI